MSDEPGELKSLNSSQAVSSVIDWNIEEEIMADAASEEPWLISYADLMTLLFGFFALLFSYASLDDELMVKVDKDIVKYFGGVYISPTHKMAQAIKSELNKAQNPNGDGMKFDVAEHGLEVAFISSVLFPPGKADLLPEAVESIKTLIKVILEAERNSEIRIEGHTDDNPISNSVFPSNWELSAARAGAILRLFESQGFPESKLSIAGYGSSRPAYPNRNEKGEKIEENQSHNRRVIINVILPKGQKRNESIEVKS